MAATIQDVIMLFGDSITQGAWAVDMNGFGQRLSDAYVRKLDVLNRGLSGYNTDWAMPVFKRCLATLSERENVPTVQLLTIWFGANDASLWPSSQHVPLDRFTSNISEWIDMLQSPQSRYYSPQTRIILISPPPVNKYQHIPDRVFLTTKMYAEAVKKLAQEKQVAFTDVWTVVWQAAGEDERSLSKFLYDGLHLNAEGYRIMYDALMKTIGEKYPEVHPDNLNPAFPPWLDVAVDKSSDK